MTGVAARDAHASRALGERAGAPHSALGACIGVTERDLQSANKDVSQASRDVPRLCTGRTLVLRSVQLVGRTRNRKLITHIEIFAGRITTSRTSRSTAVRISALILMVTLPGLATAQSARDEEEKLIRMLVDAGDIDQVHVAIESGKYTSHRELLSRVLAGWIIDRGSPIQFERSAERDRADAAVVNRLHAGRASVYARARTEIAAQIASMMGGKRGKGDNGPSLTEFDSRYRVPDLDTERSAFILALDSVVPLLERNEVATTSTSISATISVLTTAAWTDASLRAWALRGTLEALRRTTPSSLIAGGKPGTVELVQASLGTISVGDPAATSHCEALWACTLNLVSSLRTSSANPAATEENAAALDTLIGVVRLAAGRMRACSSGTTSTELERLSTRPSCGLQAYAAQAVAAATHVGVPSPVATSAIEEAFTQYARRAVVLMVLGGSVFNTQVLVSIRAWLARPLTPIEAVDASRGLAAIAKSLPSELSGWIGAMKSGVRKRLTDHVRRAATVRGGYSCLLRKKPRVERECVASKRVASGQECVRCTIRHDGTWGNGRWGKVSYYESSNCSGGGVINCQKWAVTYDSQCLRYGNVTRFDHVTKQRLRLHLSIPNDHAVALNVDLSWVSKEAPAGRLIPPRTIRVDGSATKSVAIDEAAEEARWACPDLSKIMISSVEPVY